MVLTENNGNWKSVPLPIFIAIVGFLCTIIIALVAWTWGAYVERNALTSFLSQQFARQIEVAMAAAEKVRVAETLRVDQLQRDISDQRARLDRYIEKEKQ